MLTTYDTISNSSRKRKLEDSYIEEKEYKKSRLMDPFSASISDSTHIAMSITGKSNSGKTRLLSKKILASDYFKYTFTAGNIIYVNDSLDTTIPDSFPNIIHVKASSLTDDQIGHSLLKILESEGGCEKLIIFDDMTHRFPPVTKTTILAQALKKMVNSGRHSKLNYILIAQKYTSIHPYLRANLHHCILFKPNTKIECTAMIRDNEEYGIDMLKTVITSLKEHECCFVNKQPATQKRYLWNESSFVKL